MADKIDKDDTAARKPQPAMTQAMGTKVKASSDVADALDFVDQGVPREGDSRLLTTSVPIASRRMSGNGQPGLAGEQGRLSVLRPRTEIA